MFSSRTPADLTPNCLTGLVNRAKEQGRAIIDLTESNPTRAGFSYPTDLLRSLGDPRGLSYAPSPFGLAETRSAVSRDYARRGFDVPLEHIALTASTSEAYGCLFKLLADADDEILVPRPSYPLFDHLARLDQVVACSYDLRPERGWRIDVASIEAALSPRTRAILLVSPNNPTGSFVTGGEFEHLAGLAADRQIAIIADEVFADYELTPGSRASAGRVVDRTEGLVFSLGGLSKSVGLPQAKLAWIAAAGGRSEVAAALERLELICDTYLSVSTPVQLAAADLLQRGAAVREQIARRISANYGRLRDQTASAPLCRLLESEGGWYAILKVAECGSEEALVVDLLSHDGVLVHPGYFFDCSAAGSYLILSLIPPEAQFAEGVARVLRRIASPVRQ
jgi:aspartate/methionine/tyrosine aminotransferase